MAIKIFLLGRPGCGKSSAAKYIIEHMQDKKWSIQRFKDFDILKEMSEEEQYSQAFKPTLYDGFDVIDEYVFDVALKELDARLCNHVSNVETDQIILIEFARDDYAKALRHFSSVAVQDAYFLFIDAYLDACIERVKQRMIHPTSSDDHYISEEAIQKFYVKQDLPASSNLLPGKFEKIDNYGSWQDFIRQIDNVVKDIFKP